MTSTETNTPLSSQTSQPELLALCNSYPAADEVTAQYFLFAALRQFQINPEVTTVHFYGEAGETIKGDLFRHFASVEEL